MILSSYTFNVSYEAAGVFEKNMRGTWLQDFEKLGFVKEIKFYKLLTELENGGDTFSVQLFFEEMFQYLEFEMNCKDQLLNMIDSEISGHFVFFQSLLEEC